MAMLTKRIDWPKPQVGVHFQASRVDFVTEKASSSETSAVAYDLTKRKVVAVGEEAEKSRSQEGVELRNPCEYGQLNDLRMALPLIEQLKREAKSFGFASQALVCIPAKCSQLGVERFEEALLRSGFSGVIPVPTILAASLGFDIQEEFGARFCLHIESDRFEYGWVTESTSHATRHEVLTNDLITIISDKLKNQEEYESVTFNSAALFRAHLNIAPPVLSFGNHELEQVEIKHDDIVDSVQPVCREIVHRLKSYLAELPIGVFEQIVQRPLLLSGVCIPGLKTLLENELEVSFIQGPADAPAQGLKRILSDTELRSRVQARSALTPTRKRYTTNKTESRLLASVLVMLTTLLTVAYLPTIRQGIPTPVDRALGAVIAPAQEFLASLRDRDLPSTYESALKLEEHRRFQELSAENARLSGLLRTKMDRGKELGIEPVLARVISRAPAGSLSHITLNKGSLDGLEKGMIVSSESGLVGIVNFAGESSSRCQLYTDKNVVLSATIKNSKASGVVIGGGAATLLEMHYLQPNSGVKVGDLVLTSGQDGIYPEGLELARVSRFAPDGDGTYQTLGLEPTTDFTKLREVLVLRGQ